MRALLAVVAGLVAGRLIAAPITTPMFADVANNPLAPDAKAKFGTAVVIGLAVPLGGFLVARRLLKKR